MDTIVLSPNAPELVASGEPWPIQDLQALSCSLLGVLFDVQHSLIDKDGAFRETEDNLKRLARVFVRLTNPGKEDEGYSTVANTVSVVGQDEKSEETADNDTEDMELHETTFVLLAKPPHVNEKVIWKILDSTFLRSVWNLVNMFIDARANHSLASTLLIQSAPRQVDWPFPAIANVYGLLDNSALEKPPVIESSFIYKPLPSPQEWFRGLILWPAQKKHDLAKCSLAFERITNEVRSRSCQILD